MSVAEEAGRALDRALAGNAPTLFLVSGGSSLPLLSFIRPELLGPHLTIGVVDERYSSDPKINNFAQLVGTEFYKNASDRHASFIDTRPKDEEGLQGLSARFDSSLKEWRDAHPQGRIVITQGIGPDGHTAGIMPFPENPEKFKTLFENPAMWAVGYDASGKSAYPLRVTVTLPFLREVDVAIVYAVGDIKRTALKQGLHETHPLNEVPAGIIKEIRGSAVYTDQEMSPWSILRG